MRILIAGGGVGGLTLALMLHAQGIECVVFEAADEVKPLGVGINALPHAIGELKALGLLPQLDALAIRTRSLTYTNHLGQQIWSEPRGLGAGHKVPQFSIHRGRLQAMLWRNAVERLGTEAIRPNHRLVGFTQSKTGVTAQFAAADGTKTKVQGDALIGADGIHSWLRAKLHPADPGIRWNGDHHVARCPRMAGIRWRGCDGHRRGRHRQARPVSDRAGHQARASPDQLGHLRARRGAQRADAGARELVAARPLRRFPPSRRTAASALHRDREDDPRDSRYFRISDVRSRPAAVVDEEPGHPARGCGASDVSGRIERRLPGYSRCPLPDDEAVRSGHHGRPERLRSRAAPGHGRGGALEPGRRPRAGRRPDRVPRAQRVQGVAGRGQPRGACRDRAGLRETGRLCRGTAT